MRTRVVMPALEHHNAQGWFHVGWPGRAMTPHTRAWPLVGRLQSRTVSVVELLVLFERLPLLGIVAEQHVRAVARYAADLGERA